MTFKILLFLALTALATCETSFRPHNPLSLLHEGAPESIDQFFGGVFKHFNLSEPTQIPSCFGVLDTIAFFASIHEAQNIIEAISERKNFELYIHLIEQFILNLFYRKTATCIAATQDFTDLLDALEIEERDYKLFASANFLYLQAHFKRLLKDFEPIIGPLDNKNYEVAGKAYGKLIQNMVEAIQKEKFGYLYYVAYSNGFATGVDVSYPNDSLKAWNSTTGGLFVRFLFGLSEAVSEGEKEDALENAAKFWKDIGEDLLNQIPKSVWEQVRKSKDHQEVTKKLGVDILSEEFGILAKHYIKNNPDKFYVEMKLINSNMKSLNFMNAGYYQAKFVKMIAEN